MAGRKSEKHWREALMVAVHRHHEDDDGVQRQALAIIADRVVAAALEGKMDAVREIADRLDGKAPTTADVEVTMHREPTEMTDAQLAAIAAGGSTGATEAPEGEG